MGDGVGASPSKHGHGGGLEVTGVLVKDVASLGERLHGRNSSMLGCGFA